MQTVTLPKTEYQELNRVKRRYEMMRKLLQLDSFDKPTTKNTKKIIDEFRKTRLYNEDFLKSLERGLKDSPYFSKSR